MVFDAAEITSRVRELAARHEQLHERLSRVIGAVPDYASLTTAEMARYGLKKLGVEPPASGDDASIVALEFFLHGRAGSGTGVAGGMDSAPDSAIDRYLRS